MKISVVMAVYNGENYLQDAVESILAQSFQEFEFIIVNDGSTDSSGHILDQLVDHRVKVFHLPKNRGAAAALNLAIEKARGSWIAVHDADDISFPDRLEKQEQYLRLYPQVAAVFTLIECLPGKNSFSELELRAVEKLYNSVRTRAQIYANRFYALHLCHGSAIFSKKLFQLAGGYNPLYSIAYDYDLWVRLLMLQPIDKIPQVLYRWRVDRCSLHRADEAETCREVVLIALRSIRRVCYEHLKSKPRFFLFGPEKGCWNFARRIAPFVDLQFCAYLFTDSPLNLGAAVRLYRAGSIDGIAVLDGPRCAGVLHYFSAAGMTINRNLFHLWNVVI